MAFQSYVSIKATRQGQLKPGSKKTGRSDKWTEVLSFDMSIAVPVDPLSGQVTGQRVVEPFKLTMEAGPWSPQLIQCLCTNEVLTEVVIEVVDRTATGAKEQVVERTTLNNAVISKIERYSSTHGKEGKTDYDVGRMEDISITYRTIMVENLLASTSVTEDFNTPG